MSLQASILCETSFKLGSFHGSTARCKTQWQGCTIHESRRKQVLTFPMTTRPKKQHLTKLSSCHRFTTSCGLLQTVAIANAKAMRGSPHPLLHLIINENPSGCIWIIWEKTMWTSQACPKTVHHPFLGPSRWWSPSTSLKHHHRHALVLIPSNPDAETLNNHQDFLASRNDCWLAYNFDQAKWMSSPFLLMLPYFSIPYSGQNRIFPALHVQGRVQGAREHDFGTSLFSTWVVRSTVDLQLGEQQAKRCSKFTETFCGGPTKVD